MIANHKIAMWLLCGVCLTVALGLSGCGDKKNQETVIPPAPSASNTAAEEITRRIQEPQNRAREAQDLILEAEQRRMRAADDASQ